MTAEWAVDTGQLSHFARAGWLGVLQMLAPGNVIVIPDTVEREIQEACGVNAWLAQILTHSWIEVAPIQSEAEIDAYSRYARRLVGDNGRNTGECGVLALAEVHGLVAVVDDHAGHKAGSANGVRVPSNAPNSTRRVRPVGNRVGTNHQRLAPIDAAGSRSPRAYLRLLRGPIALRDSDHEVGHCEQTISAEHLDRAGVHEDVEFDFRR